jgi:broad specificity phosphatase PhoE
MRSDVNSWKVRRLGLALLLALSCTSPTPRPENGTLRIYLARHGQTDWNAERRLQGQSDTHLDETGRRQASQLAEFMRPIPLDAVYSSTLHRSRETAEIVRGGKMLTSLDGLREQSLGKFEGLRLAGEDTVLVAEFWRRIADPADRLDGGESAEQMFQRVRQTVASIRQRHSSGSILIVGHGGTNQMILRSLLDLTMEQADSIRQANDELYLIEIDPEAPPRLWKRLTTEQLDEL